MRTITCCILDLQLVIISKNREVDIIHFADFRLVRDMNITSPFRQWMVRTVIVPPMDIITCPIVPFLEVRITGCRVRYTRVCQRNLYIIVTHMVDVHGESVRTGRTCEQTAVATTLSKAFVSPVVNYEIGVAIPVVVEVIFNTELKQAGCVQSNRNRTGCSGSIGNIVCRPVTSTAIIAFQREDMHIVAIACNTAV